MASTILFHGPGARSAALSEATRIGRLVAPPFGDDGLKVDDARDIVELLQSNSAGDQNGAVVIGPLDEALPKSTDALLKTLEEYDGTTIQPILWAHDLGGVSRTIQSRCLERWAESQGEDSEKEIIFLAAIRAIEAALKKDRAEVVAIMKTLKKKKPKDDDEEETEEDETDEESEELKGWERVFLGALIESLSSDILNPEYLPLWDSLRKVSRWHNPTSIELLSALVLEA